MAAHDQTDYLLPRGRRLWHKICEKKHADHLINCLKEQYKLTKDWNSNLYCGIAFQWNYAAQTLYISMPGYIKKTIIKIRARHAAHATLPVLTGAKKIRS